VAIDYAHDLEERAAGVHPAGTLVGYRAGRAVLAVPDGSCDITAHVALDAVADAAAAQAPSAVVDQRSALRALGVAAHPPPRELAEQDPPAYLAALAGAGEAGELLARTGLGGFRWLVSAVDCPLPAWATGGPGT
jgi:SAM-dependent MidA family methyltransferase